jgi:hypothetical protein
MDNINKHARILLILGFLAAGGATGCATAGAPVATTGTGCQAIPACPACTLATALGASGYAGSLTGAMGSFGGCTYTSASLYVARGPSSQTLTMPMPTPGGQMNDKFPSIAFKPTSAAIVLSVQLSGTWLQHQVWIDVQ